MATVSYWLCLSYPISCISLHPRPHTPLGRSYSTVLRKGASSLALFKYPTILFRRLGHSIAPNLSDNDSADIEDLRLMSLLKFVYFLLTPIPPLFLCSLLTGAPRLPAFPSAPSFPSPPHPHPKSRPEFGPSGLPHLPQIDSLEVEMRVFTHRSFAARPTHVFEDSPEDPSPDNEQFSHVRL